MSSTVLEAGEVVTLLTSFCEDDNEKCTDRHPCAECIPMCNTFEITEKVVANYTGQVGKDL